jgi:hypothetical protein
MRILIRTSLICLMIILASGCSTVTYTFKTRPLSDPDTAGGHGIIYYLPCTVVRVSVTMERRMVVPGPYHEYAKKYLGIENVPQQVEQEWRILEIACKTSAEPDPGEFYVVTAVMGSLSEEMFSSFASKGITFFSISGDREYSASGIMPGQALSRGIVYTDLSVKKNLVEDIDTLYKTILTDSNIVRVPVFVKDIVNKSLEEKAVEAADYIIKIRKNKFNLLAGADGFYPDGQAITFGIGELDKLEHDYTTLFTGRSFSDTLTRDFIYIPDGAEEYENIKLFEFSLQEGPFARPGSGEFISLMLRKSGATRMLEDYAWRLDPIADNVLYYRIPDIADLEVQRDGIPLFRDRIEVFQYGTVVTAPVILQE